MQYSSPPPKKKFRKGDIFHFGHLTDQRESGSSVVIKPVLVISMGLGGEGRLVAGAKSGSAIAKGVQRPFSWSCGAEVREACHKGEG